MINSTLFFLSIIKINFEFSNFVISVRSVIIFYMHIIFDLYTDILNLIFPMKGRLFFYHRLQKN